MDGWMLTLRFFRFLSEALTSLPVSRTCPGPSLSQSVSSCPSLSHYIWVCLILSPFVSLCPVCLILFQFVSFCPSWASYCPGPDTVHQSNPLLWNALILKGLTALPVSPQVWSVCGWCVCVCWACVSGMTAHWTEVATPTRTIIPCRWFPMATQLQVRTSHNLIRSYHDTMLEWVRDILTDKTKIWTYYIIIIIKNINNLAATWFLMSPK